jgi:hypothetical protein
MTIQEIKLEAIRRGYLIVERKELNENKEFVIGARVDKYEDDGLFWYGQTQLTPEQYGSEMHVEFIRVAITETDKAIQQRKERDPNTCSHNNDTIIGSKHYCIDCRVKLQDVITSVQNWN